MADQDKEKKTQWHSPMYRGLQLDLRGNTLRFDDNVCLSEEALRIDVVIEKDADIRVEKDIGAIFRVHNICELKSETDYFSVDDYAKVVYGYAGIYASLYSVCVNDITITIVVSKYPQKLVKFLEEERGLRVENKGNGIHYVVGDAFPVQILETKKLSKNNIFLRNLRSNLTQAELQETLQALEKAGVTDKRDAYLECLVRANWNTFREVIRMMPEFKEIFLETAEEDGWLEERDRKIARETARETAREIARGLKQDNIPLNVIVKNTGLTLQEVEAI